ncbi:MAG: hypothetical protein ABSF89_09220 [Acidimicrobiales bacterium]|jgi:hypothetical protein
MAWGKVFEGLPPGLSREETLFFDAVDLLIPACQLQYRRIVEVAAVFTEVSEATDAEAKALKGDLQTILMADAGSLVATVQRLRRVLPRLHGDETLRLAKKAFESAVKPFEEARHYVEHLDTAIPVVVLTGQGALGGLSWFFFRPETNEKQWVFVYPGHLGPGMKLSNRIEHSARPPVDHVWANIGGADYCLTKAADAVERLRERLANWSKAWQ